MIRMGMHVLTAMLILGGPVWGETVTLTRVDNGAEQWAVGEGMASSFDVNPPYAGPGAFEDPFPTYDDYNAEYDLDLESACNFNIALCHVITTAYCTVAPTAYSYNPTVGVVSGGPMIITGASGYAHFDAGGGGQSVAYFTVGEPVTNPNATLVATGTITITASDSEHSKMGGAVYVGDSYIICTSEGCTGVIKDLSAPGGSYTVSTSSQGGTWSFSQYVTKNTSVLMKATGGCNGKSDEDCSEYPDFNAAGTMTVNTQ